MNTGLEKQRNILDYGLMSLWRRKTKNLSVLLVFALVIFLMSSFQFLTGALTDVAQQSLRLAPEITVQKMVAGRQEQIPISYGDKLQEIFGIRRVEPRVWGYHFSTTTGGNITMLGVSSFDPRLETALLHGRLPSGSSAGEVVLGQGVVRDLDLKGRRKFSFFRPELTQKTFTVTGEFKPESELLTADLMVMSIADSRDFFHISETYATDLLVTVANPAEIETIARKIAELLPDTRVVTRPQILKTYNAVFGWRSGFGSVCLLTGLAAFIILAWDKASGMTPEEKREIGILKLLGWQTSDVLAVRFYESFAVSFLALLLGCTLGYVHIAFFDGALFRPVMFGWSVITPHLHLVPVVRFGDVLLVICFTVLPYLAVTIIPAWRAASVPPDSAMR
ncbi:MAG: FtsX-like permease family protein [Desulfobulbaceae bacterium]|nr:FtsX-like permease family protein [Desulfobulbaceae bacterium]